MWLIVYFSKSLTYGLSSCLRRLKSGTVNTLIISADLKPRYVINQIILLALTRNKSINVVCVSNLNNRLSQILPFSCFCFCMVKHDDDRLRPIIGWCKSIIEINHPIDQQYCHIPQKNETQNQDEDSNILEAANATNIEMQAVSFEKLYLMKPACERAFVPNNSKICKTFTSSNDFISLGDNNEHEPNSMAIDADAVTIDAEVRSKLDDIQIVAHQWESKEVKKEFYRLHGKSERKSYLDQQIKRGKHKTTKGTKSQQNSPKMQWSNKYNDVKVNKVQSNINKNKNQNNMNKKAGGTYVKIKNPFK